MTKLAIVIPAFEPDEKLFQLVEELRYQHFVQLQFETLIIIVDDGTRDVSGRNILDRCKSIDGVLLLRHEKNCGKGAAIKTAVKFANENEYDFVVTADADGQHLPKDIAKVSIGVIDTNQFTMGVRNFADNVPLRSRIGNGVTAKIIQWIFKTKLADTQSGLRAFPTKYFQQMLSIPENRYEYEFQSLINVLRNEEINQIPITTVYEEGNPTSHFRPIHDSVLIYMVLLRYLIMVPLISGFDFLAFWILTPYLGQIWSFAIVRSLTVFIYFIVIRNLVFKSKNNSISQSIRFLVLVLFNLFVTLVLFREIDNLLSISPMFVYVMATVILFFFNFVVQRSLIFKDDKIGQ